MSKKSMQKGPGKQAGPAPAGKLPGNSLPWIAGLLAVTFLVYLPSVKNGFVSFDDPHYVQENPFIKGFTGDNLREIFFHDANGLGNYHPLTLLSLAANHAVSGLNPAPYHLTSILIHLLNTLLVFQLAMMLFGRYVTGRTRMLSAVAALLFGIHPLHAESVMWVSARKDLLYTCFYLLAMIAWVKYLDRKTAGQYLLSLLFFLLSLLSKGMAVTLPVALVAMDYLCRRKFPDRKAILDKIPFLALSLVFGLIAVTVQQAQGATDIVRSPLPERVVFASYGFTQYLLKLVIPYKLSVFYPYPGMLTGGVPWYCYPYLAGVLLFASALAWFAFFRPERLVVFGLLFFAINMALVLQLFPVGNAVMADRYTYLSSFGIFLLAAAGLGYLVNKYPSQKPLIPGLFLAYAAVLGVVTVKRAGVWENSYTFWNDVQEKYPEFYPAINNLGVLYKEDGKTGEALQMFSKSIGVYEKNPVAYFHRGSILGKSGQLNEAITDLDRAILYEPDFTKAYVNRAIAKAMLKDYPGAVADLDRVLAKEKNEEAYINRGTLRNEMKDYPSAIADFGEAVKLNPSCTNCYYFLGLANYHAGRYPDAVKALSACIDLNPSADYAYYYRALSNIGTGRSGEVCDDLQRAYKLGVRDAGQAMEKYCRQ